MDTPPPTRQGRYPSPLARSGWGQEVPQGRYSHPPSKVGTSPSQVRTGEGYPKVGTPPPTVEGRYPLVRSGGGGVLQGRYPPGQGRYPRHHGRYPSPENLLHGRAVCLLRSRKRIFLLHIKFCVICEETSSL